MFRFARFVVRHKVGATALVALGVFVMTPGQDDQAAKSTNPWAAQSQTSTVASADEPGFVGSMVDGAVDYLDENDLNPMGKADETVNRFDNTASAYSKANH